MIFINQLKGYHYVYSNSAKKDLRKVNKNDATKIDKKLKLLVSGSIDLDIKKLTGYKDPQYRLRVGDYRVIYKIYEDKIIVLIINIKHRKDVYRGQKG